LCVCAQDSSSSLEQVIGFWAASCGCPGAWAEKSGPKKEKDLTKKESCKKLATGLAGDLRSKDREEKAASNGSGCASASPRGGSPGHFQFGE